MAEVQATRMGDEAEACADGLLVVGGVTLASRLVVGTGKYATYAEMARCL